MQVSFGATMPSKVRYQPTLQALLIIVFFCSITAISSEAESVRWDSYEKRARLKIEIGSTEQQRQSEPATTARAILYRLNEVDERYIPVWEAPLLNPLRPEHVLITEDGRFVITLDDQRITGYGPNVVVIYGDDGKLIAHYSLEQLLNSDEISKLSSAICSYVVDGLFICHRQRYWHKSSHIDAKQSHLVLVTNLTDEAMNEAVIRIDLATGKIISKESVPKPQPVNVK